MSATQTIIRSLPTIVTLAVLAGVGWWGHHTGWSFGKSDGHAAAEAHGGEESEGGWCAEHNVTEADCVKCRKDLGKSMVAKEPKEQVAKGEDVQFAQVASVEVLSKVNVTTGTVEETTIEPQLTAAAETQYDPTRVARVPTRAGGVVRRVLKQLGDPVAAGDVIALVEAAEVGKAKSELMRALSEQTVAEAMAVRARASSAAGFRTAAEAQEAEARLRAAQVMVFDAEQGLLNLGLAVDAAEVAKLKPDALTRHLRTLGLPEQLAAEATSANLLPVIAPHAGTITELHAVAGEAAEADAPLAVVADTSRLMLAIHVPADSASRLAPGQTVTFRYGDGLEAKGAIAVVSSAIDEETRLLPVRATVDNGGGTLRANQYGTATIILGAPQKVVVVPGTAIQRDGSASYVFVRRTPTVFRGLPVSVVAKVGDSYAVDRVLSGDEIALSGTEVLKGSLFPEKFGPGCTCGPEEK